MSTLCLNFFLFECLLFLWNALECSLRMGTKNFNQKHCSCYTRFLLSFFFLIIPSYKNLEKKRECKEHNKIEIFFFNYKTWFPIVYRILEIHTEKNEVDITEMFIIFLWRIVSNLPFSPRIPIYYYLYLIPCSSNYVLICEHILINN